MKSYLGMIFLFFSPLFADGLHAGHENMSRRNFWFTCGLSFFTGTEVLGKHHQSFEEKNAPDSKWSNLPLPKLGFSFKQQLIERFGFEETQAEVQRVRMQELLWNRIKIFVSVLESRDYQVQGEVTFKDVVFLNEFELDLPSGDSLSFEVRPTWHLVVEKTGTNSILIKKIIPVGDLESFVSQKMEEGKK